MKRLNWKWLFGLVGLVLFASILRGYGFDRLAGDIAGLGWWAPLLALSFLPVAFCYSTAWLIVTPEAPIGRIFDFFRLTAISLAWNNLSPFVKVLGEGVRVLQLERSIGRKPALKSMVLYNIAHLYGTMIAFIVGAVAILAIYPLPPGVRYGFLSLISVTVVALVSLYGASRKLKRGRGKRGGNHLGYRIRFWMHWSSSKVRIFSAQHPGRFLAAISFEVAARFIEGATFFVAFRALGDPIPPLDASLLDVGRALMDNLFFFIPYQVGSREAGIQLLTKHVMHVGVRAAVSAAILYRLVEILWIGIGYLLWIKAERDRKSST